MSSPASSMRIARLAEELRAALSNESEGGGAEERCVRVHLATPVSRGRVWIWDLGCGGDVLSPATRAEWFALPLLRDERDGSGDATASLLPQCFFVPGDAFLKRAIGLVLWGDLLGHPDIPRNVLAVLRAQLGDLPFHLVQLLRKGSTFSPSPLPTCPAAALALTSGAAEPGPPRQAPSILLTLRPNAVDARVEEPIAGTSDPQNRARALRYLREFFFIDTPE